MESMFKNWVLYREDSNTHQEIYFVGLRSGEPVTTDELEQANYFESAGEAYRFAGHHQSLQWWRAGKR